MKTIRLTDSSLGTFEQTLISEGFVRTFHEYAHFTMFDIWENGKGSVWHVDQVVSSGNVYIASKRS